MFLCYLHVIIAVIYINYIIYILFTMSFIYIIIKDKSLFNWKFLFFLFSYKDLKISIESF